MPGYLVPGEPLHGERETVGDAIALVWVHDGEIIAGSRPAIPVGKRVVVRLAVLRAAPNRSAIFGAIVFVDVCFVVEKRHAALFAGIALAGWAQPQAAAEVSGMILVCGGIGDIAYGVLFRVHGAAQSVGPVICERALLEHRLAVPSHEDGSAILHGAVAVELPAVDDHGAVVRFRAVSEINSAAAGRVQRGVVHLPIALEGAAVDHQMIAGPDRAATRGIPVSVRVVNRLADIIGKRSIVDDEGAVAPDYAAAMVGEIAVLVGAGGVTVKGTAIDGDFPA